MAKEYSRIDRISDFIYRELASLIQMEIQDPRVGMVNITSVKVTRDLSYAKVFVSFFEKPNHDESIKALNHAAGFLRSAIARKANFRTVPKIIFEYDDTLDKGRRIEALLKDTFPVESPTDAGIEI